MRDQKIIKQCEIKLLQRLVATSRRNKMLMMKLVVTGKEENYQQAGNEN